jgi:WD40 repeat protein
VKGVAFAGEDLLAVGRPRAVELWRLPGERLHSWPADADVTALAGSPAGPVIAWTARGTGNVVDVRTGREVAKLAGHPDSVQALAFSADATHLAAGGSEGTVRLWDVRRRGK